MGAQLDATAEAEREIARLEALGAERPSSPAFPAYAEAQRRAGRPEVAERVAREGLRRQPSLLAGRVALGLALLDQGRLDEARRELERVLDAVPDHPLAETVLGSLHEQPTPASSPSPAPAPPAAVSEEEIEAAFAQAEPEREAMLDSEQVALQAIRAAELDEPEGVATGPDSPLATRTVAELLERQGDEEQARAVREAAAERERRERLGLEVARSTDEAARRRQRAIRTLERWLERLRKEGR